MVRSSASRVYLTFVCLLLVYHNVQTILYISRQDRTSDSNFQRTSFSNPPALPSESIASAQRFSNESSKPLCSREQVISGSWVPELLPRPPYVSRNKHLRCLSKEEYSVSPFRSWAWKPHDSSSTCRWTLWNSTAFCSKMQYATISIIGDSLSWEQYSSLLQLLVEAVSQMDQHRSKSQKRNHKQPACFIDKKHDVKNSKKFRTSVIFRNDPYLRYINESIQQDFPLVLVLNRGAHYVEDEVLSQDIQRNIHELHSWQQLCRLMKIKCHLFWRTTVPGHVHCQNFTQPVNDLKVMERFVANLELYSDRQLTFHWHDFERQNQLVLRALEASGLDYRVLDAYKLTVLRPDGHRIIDSDCLHNCYPGKMDVFNQLLLHYLEMDRTDSDVDMLKKKMEKVLERRRKNGRIQ